MHSSRFVHPALLCVVLAVGATACGPSRGSSSKAVAPLSAPASASASASPSGLDFDNMSADQILDQAKTAMTSLSSVRVVGYVITGDQKVTLDLSIDKSQNCKGSAAVGDTGTMDVIHTSAGTWIKPDTAFWQSMAAKEGNAQQGPAVAEAFKGRWLSAGQDDPDLKDLAGMCGLLSSFSGDSARTSATKGRFAFIKGAQAQVIDVTDDNGPGILYVAAEGKPYLIREVNNGSDRGIVDLGDFDKPVDVQAPPADQVIDVSAFKQKVNSV